MDERHFYALLLRGFFVVSAIVAPLLFFIKAPYGRHQDRAFGPTVPAVLGWVLMEAPSPLGFALWFALGDRHGAAALAFFLLWQAHYVNRAFLYPFRLRAAAPMAVVVMATGLAFNLVNAYLNGRWLYTLGPAYTAAWLLDPRFLIGAAMFGAGFALNLQSDRILRGLRRPGERGYKVPRGGLFRLVSCPNYLGEIIEWCGWAVATWSLPGLAFALWTAANLAPRARAHHRFYQQRFPDYPAERRALVPFLF